jgi:uncharacterized membrane protein YdbT with pleckstrin-like domain
MKTVETTAAEVWYHAADHGDRPVIHGAELDYDDVHDGVHYHADLVKAAIAASDKAKRAMTWTAEKVAIRAMLAADRDEDPREFGTGWAEEVAEYKAARETWMAAVDRGAALRAKAAQDAAFATYDVGAVEVVGEVSA